MSVHDEPPSTNPSEIEALIARLEDGRLGADDRRLIARLLRLLLTLIRVVEHKNTSISRLKRLLFGPGSDRRAATAPTANAASNDAASAVEEAMDATTPAASQIAEPRHRRGHGRHGAAAYTGARRVVCVDPELAPGDCCPQALCRGQLYDTRTPSLFIRLEGRPIIAATRYEQQVLRCAACQMRFTAPLPEDIPPQKYAASADVAIALYKYGAGMPFYRQARLQAMVGVPLPESVQYERCAFVAACVRPVYDEMVRHAARSRLFHTDDTRVVILELLAANAQLAIGARRAVQTSGIVACEGERQIVLYMSGRRHAGENLAALLRQRPPDLSPPIQMADALFGELDG